MKIFIIVIGVLLALTGCKKQNENENSSTIGTPSTLVSFTPKQADPSIFEVQDFKMTSEKVFDSTYIHSVATIIAKDPRLQIGKAMLMISFKEAHKGGTHRIETIEIEDGIGKLDLTASRPTSDPDWTPHYIDWKAIGYLQFMPATISFGNTAVPSEGKVPAFNMREFTYQSGKNDNGKDGVFGKGILQSSDPNLQKGMAIVILAVQKGEGGGVPTTIGVELIDGMAAVKTFDIIDENKTPNYHNWRVVGFIPFQTATVNLRNSETQSAINLESKFEIRDLAVKKEINRELSSLSYYNVDGMLVSKVAEIQATPHFVLLEYTRENGEKETLDLIIRDGVGTFNKRNFIDSAKLANVTIANWRIQGYAPLAPAKLVGM